MRRWDERPPQTDKLFVINQDNLLTGVLLLHWLLVPLLNGLVWGGVIGVVAWLLDDSTSLGLVMTAAKILNLLLAAFAGVGIPILMTKFGRDPALGSSVVITAMTDSGVFFIFLGLTTIFLL